MNALEPVNKLVKQWQEEGLVGGEVAHFSTEKLVAEVLSFFDEEKYVISWIPLRYDMSVHLHTGMYIHTHLQRHKRIL